MLKIVVPEFELYDEETNSFNIIPTTTLQLEHSLVSISKWESKWHKAFMSKQPKTNEEVNDYIKCMTITQNVNPLVYSGLTRENVNAITEYIDDPYTATVINRKETSGSREIVTAELIYYWMVALNIPLECQKWHLNRLITFIEVCSIKNKPPKKMSQKAIANQNRSLNNSRRSKHNSRG